MSARRPWPLEVRQEAVRLRTAGEKYKDISAQLGVPMQTIHAWVSDPDGSATKARKARYQQPCVDCGTLTHGGDGLRPEPRCHPCGAKHSGELAKVWTREAILTAFREWHALYGEPPAQPDWMPWTAETVLGDVERAQRFRDANGRWPQVSTVCREFGCWSEATRAAGYTPRPAHGGGSNVARRWRRHRDAA